MRVKNWDYRELRERIADGYTLRHFTDFNSQRVPQHDAFNRAFYRLKWGHGDSAILIHYDPGRIENTCYADIATFLLAIDVPVPRLIRHDPDGCLILMEDLELELAVRQIDALHLAADLGLGRGLQAGALSRGDLRRHAALRRERRSDQRRHGERVQQLENQRVLNLRDQNHLTSQDEQAQSRLEQEKEQQRSLEEQLAQGQEERERVSADERILDPFALEQLGYSEDANRNKTSDWQIVGPHGLNLRAERAGGQAHHVVRRVPVQPPLPVERADDAHELRRVGGDLPEVEVRRLAEVLVDRLAVRARERDPHRCLRQLCASFCASEAFACRRFATSKTRFIVPVTMIIVMTTRSIGIS